MWEYRAKKASGNSSERSTDALPHGSFLPFEKPDMVYYTNSPQETPVCAPKVPDSYFNIAKIKNLPNTIAINSKQVLAQETICRQNVQILGHVVWFKTALEELNGRINTLSEEIRTFDDVSDIREIAILISKYSQMQSSITSSLEIALDTVLKQNMTMACNLLLARRDNLLKDCNTKIGPKDIARLRTESFIHSEVFSSELVSNVEDNLIKRMSILKESETSSTRKPYRSENRSGDTRSSQQRNSESDRNNSFRNSQSNTPNYRFQSARAARGGRGGRRK